MLLSRVTQHRLSSLETTLCYPRLVLGHLTDYSTLCPGTAGGFQSTFRFVSLFSSLLSSSSQRLSRTGEEQEEEVADAHQPRHSATVGNTHATEDEQKQQQKKWTTYFMHISSDNCAWQNASLIQLDTPITLIIIKTSAIRTFTSCPRLVLATCNVLTCCYPNNNIRESLLGVVTA